MEKRKCPKTAAARKNEPKFKRKDDDGIIDFEWCYIWSMRMGFTYEEARRLTFGHWVDLFEAYKKIHNIEATNSTFKEPRKVESLMPEFEKTLSGDIIE